VAFEDIQPAAPFHALVVPRRHIATLNDLGESDRDLAGEMILAGRRLAEEAGLADPGYRLIMNCNADGGQVVFHIHLHVLGGRPLGGLVPG
jgi:histidine triad (HIT) family protein